MKTSEEQNTGGAGALEVCAAFMRLNWGATPVPPPNDLGTDIYLAARDDRLVERLLIVGAQVKTGASYFSEPIAATEDGREGWWYREGDAKHFEDWVRHPLPHLIILYDDKKRIAYWEHVTADRVVVTGNGCKIAVPKSQTVDRDHLPALLEVAATQRTGVPLEGSSWTAGVKNASPAGRLRYALLAPRLIAPHRNAGFGSPLEPEEAIALIVQARARDYLAFANRHGHPKPEQPFTSNDWRWRFFGVLWRWLVDDKPDQLHLSVATAPSSHARAAAAVCSACAFVDDERFEEAVSVLSENIEEAPPIDAAWLLVQRSRFCAEIGDMDAARHDAVAAQKMLVGEQDDLSGSVVGSAAAWLLFQTAGWDNESMASAVAASDTAVSWWRSQSVSAGLGDIATQGFRSWADDRTVRFAAEDDANNRLLAARLNAHLSAESGPARYTASLLARHKLIEEQQRGSVDGVAAQLDSLRKNGDHEALGLALKRIWKIGPLGSVRQLGGLVSPASWTHTSARSNLELWKHGGDLFVEADADACVRLSLELLTEDDHWLERRTRPAFRGSHFVIGALSGLLPVASEGMLRAVLQWVLNLPKIEDQLQAMDVAAIAEDLRGLRLDSAEVDLLRSALSTQPRPEISMKLLGILSSAGDEEARILLVDRAVAGEDRALAELGDITLLTSENAATLLDRFVKRLDRTIEEADHHAVSIGSFDHTRAVAVINVNFPDVARWDSLLSLIQHPGCAAADKRSVCGVLAVNAHTVPEDVRRQLTLALPALKEGLQVLTPCEGSLGAVGLALAVALDAFEASELEDAIAAALRGSWEERRDLAWILGRSDNPALVGCLVGLSGDDHVEVRSAVAAALASRSMRGELSELGTAALRSLSGDPGALVVQDLFSAVPHEQVPSALIREIAQAHADHLSARVRGMVEALLSPSLVGTVSA